MSMKAARLLCLSLCVVAFLGISAGSLFAVTAHVAKNGSDANPGTLEQPVATVAKGLSLVLGKTEPSELVIHKGIYPGGVQVGPYEGRTVGPLPELVITAAKNADGSFEEVVFDEARKITQSEPVAGKTAVFKIPGAYDLLLSRPQIWETDARMRYEAVADVAAVERFPASFWCSGTEIFIHTSDGRAPELHDIGISSPQREGITVWRQYTTLRGLRFRNFQAWSWSSGAILRASNTLAEDCSAWGCVHGFMANDLENAAGNVRFIRCRSEDCPNGVYLTGFRREIVEDCRFVLKRDGLLIAVDAQECAGIEFYGGGFEGEARRNLCAGFNNGIFVKVSEGSPYIIENNTCVDGVIHGVGCTGTTAGSVIRNNIVVGFASPLVMPENIVQGAVVDYNCFWQGPDRAQVQNCLDQARKKGTGEHNIVADPRFAGAASGDYRLLPASPCAKMGPNGEFCGAFGPVGADFKDVEPPAVTLALGPPGQRAGGTGELYFERDPWNGGGRNLVRQLGSDSRVDEWVSPDAQFGLIIGADDAVGKPAQMKTRIGNGEWSAPEPFVAWKETALPPGAAMVGMSVTVSDEAGNWSAPKTIMIRLMDKGPKLKGKPVVYANDKGVVVSFETDSPCMAKIEYGADKKYGSTFEQPKDVQRSWLANDGGDWVAVRSMPRVTNYLVLLPPAVVPGKTYHYRILLQDQIGNKTVGDDATVTLAGQARSYFVSPQGSDVDGGGTRDKPWRTIQFAVDRALPGDRVILLPGLYTGEAKLTHGGLPGAPISIEAETPGSVVLDGRHEASACLRLERASNVAIKGLEMRWYGHSAVYVADSDNVSVSYCRIWNGLWATAPLGNGIFVHRSPGMVADHNVMYMFEQGIQLLQSPRARITYNTINCNNYAAVQFFQGAADGSVSRNNSFAYSGNDIFSVDGNTPQQMATFDSDYNNVGATIAPFYIKYNADNNIGVGTAEEFAVKDSFLKNHGSKSVIWLDSKRYMSLKAWQEKIGKDMHSIFKDPLYVDSAHGDFRLKPDSPNIGAGEDGTNIGALGVVEK